MNKSIAFCAGVIDGVLTRPYPRIWHGFQGFRNQWYLIQYPTKALDFDIFEIHASRPFDWYQCGAKI